MLAATFFFFTKTSQKRELSKNKCIPLHKKGMKCSRFLRTSIHENVSKFGVNCYKKYLKRGGVKKSTWLGVIFSLSCLISFSSFLENKN